MNRSSKNCWVHNGRKAFPLQTLPAVAEVDGGKVANQPQFGLPYFAASVTEYEEA